MIPQIKRIFMGPYSLKEKIEIFAQSYSRFLYENPDLPNFVLNELNRDPDCFLSIINEKRLIYCDRNKTNGNENNSKHFSNNFIR